MPEMKFIGGLVCLDFINTVGARVSTRHDQRTRDYADTVLRDKLKDYRDLLMWSHMAGLASSREVPRLERVAERQPQHAARTLERVTKMREALYRILKSHLEGWRPEHRDWEILTTELAIARTHEHLVRSGTGFVWAFDDSEAALDGALWRVSQSAADLLTSAGLDQVRQCGGDECGWMFLDTSRNRTRRWCDMKDCGNRAKVRRFRQGQRGGRKSK
jgi:predicted RNA-binding Zn ribbon-like protein